MSTLDELKKEWKTATPESGHYDQPDLLAIRKARSSRQINRTFQYFWASFTLQIIVYGLLSHVLIRYGYRPEVRWGCLTGIALYLPFTIVLMRQFKRVALASPGRIEEGFSVKDRIQQQYANLRSFYRFKRVYEYALIPLSTALGVWLIFQVYVPGGVALHPTGAATIYLISLSGCWWAIYQENRNQFGQPLRILKEILDEFDQ